MSENIELARIELEIAEDLEVVTAAEVIRWLRARNESESVVAMVERAAAAAGRARRLRAQITASGPIAVAKMVETS